MLSARSEASMFSIGEFSRVTGLTIKTLRFYHQEELLVPSYVDPATGYRYYDEKQIETARAIAFLRGLELPVADIAELLRGAGDEGHILESLSRHQQLIETKIRHYRRLSRSLNEFITQERQATTMSQTPGKIEEKQLDPLLIGGVRMKGCYGDCGQGFRQIGRRLGRYLCGTPLLLHYDAEYKETDADFEACVPLRQQKTAEGINVRELPGGRCVSLVHQGPYEQLGHSYAAILKYIQERQYQIVMPTREVYLKGPGMIFKGNPKSYLTEIQMLVEEKA